MSTTDATQVTGSQVSADVRIGDVLAERYELLEALDDDGPIHAFRGVDQETERAVLVRILAGPPLDEAVLGEVLDRLEGLVGVGGRFLSSLLDVDREGRRPFTVEAWPAGTQLSAIFQARRARGESLGARELLPVLSRLNAALGALPEPWPHGDVRAERVWVDTDGLRLTGAFLLSSLEPPLLSERIRALGPGAFVYAPEVARGTLTTAADRWGVAAIVWEAMTSRAAEPASSPPELSAPVLTALRQLLEQDAARRPRELGLLLRALAQQAELPLMPLDPEAHRPPTADVGAPPADRTAPARPLTRREADQAVAKPYVAPSSVPSKPAASRPPASKPPASKPPASKPPASKPPASKPLASRPPASSPLPERKTVKAPAPKPKKIEGAASEGTQEISFDQIVDERSAPDLDPRLVRAARALAEPQGAPDDTAKHAALPASPEVSDGFDPRLVRAALGMTLESEERGELAGDSLDPMLVHAALGVTLDSDDHEVTSNEIEVAPEAPRPAPARSSPPKSASPSTPAPKIAPRPPTARATPAVLPGPAPRPRPLDDEAALEPSFEPPPAAPRPTSERPRPAPGDRPAPRPSSDPPRAEAAAPAADAPRPVPARARPPSDPPPEPEAGTQIIARPPEPPPPAPAAPRRSMTGVWIVLAAILVALAIVALGFVIAEMRAREARERQIQERLEQLRVEEPAAATPVAP
jgi:hypothetical protein